MAFYDVRIAGDKGEGFAGIKIGTMSYLFILVETNKYRTPLVEELDKQLVAFGDDLGDHGLIARAFEDAGTPATDGVMGRPGWPDKISKRFVMEFDPFILVIDLDLAAFRPNKHSWSIVWLSDYRDRPAILYRLFARLAMMTRTGGDIPEYLATLAKKKRMDKRLGAVHFKPSIAGVYIDIDTDKIDPLNTNP